MLKFYLFISLLSLYLPTLIFIQKSNYEIRCFFSCLLIKCILLWVNWRSDHENTFYGFHYNDDYNYVKYNDTLQVPDSFIKNVMLLILLYFVNCVESIKEFFTQLKKKYTIIANLFINILKISQGNCIFLIINVYYHRWL